MLSISHLRSYFFSSIALTLSLGGFSNAAVASEQTAVFAGGCFWGVDAVFKHVKGVTKVVSGYSGGSAATAHYDQVSNGNTGHAEAVEIRFDPKEVSYQQLLQVFFTVAHNPTQLNFQGPDVGTQYRSAIFYTNSEQETTAQKYIQEQSSQKTFDVPIATQVVALQEFYPAEEHHQNYLELHPYQPYIVFNDQPKVAQLHELFPSMFKP